jgi:hypothetical protein
MWVVMEDDVAEPETTPADHIGIAIDRGYDD